MFVRTHVAISIDPDDPLTHWLKPGLKILKLTEQQYVDTL